ncbi:hypothetical protein LFZ20_08430 [Salmonella enterica subsp. enterica serovar Johannesburg str. SA20025782]|nr:hypothetical protein LFZ20_08430 [Salmonella enterica subsp. enterica serovar Johannesburg str. SA20025782]
MLSSQLVTGCAVTFCKVLQIFARRANARRMQKPSSGAGWRGALRKISFAKIFMIQTAQAGAV